MDSDYAPVPRYASQRDGWELVGIEDSQDGRHLLRYIVTIRRLDEPARPSRPASWFRPARPMMPATYETLQFIGSGLAWRSYPCFEAAVHFGPMLTAMLERTLYERSRVQP